MGEVVELGVPTTLDIPPDKVLSSAIGKLGRLIIIGQTPDGEDYLASSTGDKAQMLWDLERAKMVILESP